MLHGVGGDNMHVLLPVTSIEETYDVATAKALRAWCSQREEINDHDLVTVGVQQPA